MSPVLNEGVRGLQSSQRDLTRAASEIARANVRPGAETISTPNEPPTSFAPVQRGSASESTQDLAEPLLELRRQELLFTASASVVRTADATLGSLLNTEA